MMPIRKSAWSLYVIIGVQTDTSMSPEALAQLEQELEQEGTLFVTRKQLLGLFDSRARKLVNMSGEAALQRIRGGKCSPNAAWTELSLLASLLR
jgi:hypothetical protein